MKKFLKNAFAAMLASAFVGCMAPEKEPVDYVNPYVGSISHLLVPCFPTIQLPNSLMRIYPTRSDYTTEMLDGLPVVVTNHRERSAFRLSITQGDELRDIVPVTWDNEHITPYDYQVTIADGSIDVRLAVSHQSAIYELTLLDPDKPATVTLFTENGMMLADGSSVGGSQRLSHNMKIYFSGEFDVQPEQSGLLRDGKISAEKQADAPRACAAVRFPAGTKKVQFRYGISLISQEQAAKNLRREQADGFDIAKVAADGRKEWNETLSNIRVKLPEGKELHIIANGCSRENKYIQRATLNGQPWDKPWFSHDDIKNGATLVLEMGNRPNKEWGSAEDATPPSAPAR